MSGHTTRQERMTPTVLDTFFSDVQLELRTSPVQVQPEELVHVVGTTEPVRERRDARAQSLYVAGLLTVESVQASLSEEERMALVEKVQNKARAWLQSPPTEATPEMLQQVRWLFSKTRRVESPQQIVQRVWLSAVLYNLGMRELRYTDVGQIVWQGGMAERIGLGPDRQLDAAIMRGEHTFYVTSYRRPDGTVVRGKGRQRWYVYRLTIDPKADLLFERYRQVVRENIALIVASETHATQPQLPRDFYGGDEFQQACIDAQDAQFQHALVLSPQHGVVSLDEIVPSDVEWQEVTNARLWEWETKVANKLGGYLFGEARHHFQVPPDFNWWLWLNPESVYSFTVFGGGLAVRMFFDHLLNMRAYSQGEWPHIILTERRAGYGADDFEEELEFNLGTFFPEDDLPSEEALLEEILPDLDQLMQWAALFAERVSVYVLPLDQYWELTAEEAMIPVRILHEAGIKMDAVFGALMEISFLLDHPTPFSVLTSTSPIVATLIQFAHNLLHREHQMVNEVLKMVPNPTIRHMLEMARQEPDPEDQLCAVLALTEQIQMLTLLIPQRTQDMLSVWLHTYIAGRAAR